MNTYQLEKDLLAITADIARERGAALVAATYSDPWAGPVLAVLTPYATKRAGERVLRFRWQRADGLTCGEAAYKTPRAAAAYASRNRSFADVVTVGV